MKLLIVEDEIMAAERLEEMVRRAIPGVELLGILDSISSAVKWFGGDDNPDLAFFDIQLADGLSFEIFEQTKVSCPVIFTTAFDEYALKAFKVNSIDYLLKPIDDNELHDAIQKYHNLYKSHGVTGIPEGSIDNVIKLLTRQYKSRFVVRVGERIRSIPVDEIQCFYSMEKANYIQTVEDRHYTIDHSLEQVESLVDPLKFFRVSRKFILALDAIQEIISHSNSRLRVVLNHKTEEDIIVAREKVKSFKQWLER
jgi:DNA-binding LytR/AlgR family response regulator